ncbi:unnamed protein product [Microthlaspi erraticum]|uniref:Uncharacterized protein n=1 Tax=Microthlaspi erraticum TaxID=1685480 RepID=A0A6D2KH50_9BRAS|nr:unnamed protein product [Microthlaspi erraticum]
MFLEWSGDPSWRNKVYEVNRLLHGLVRQKNRILATPSTRIFEIISIEFQRPHFKLIAKWKGFEYVMHLANSRADPTAVIEKLKEIMKSRGC